MSDATRGAKTRRKTKPHTGSLNWQLSNIEVGGYLYLEVESGDEQQLQARVQRLQASILSPTRYPESMKDTRFKVAAYTAVRATLGDVRVLVRVQRVE